MKTILFFCGLYAAAFAIFHLLFWKIFRWKTALQPLDVVNRGILQILNCRMVYFFMLVAFICFAYPAELLSSRLGHVLLGGISLFWLGRTIEQFIFLRVRDPRVHLLTVIFILGTILFALPIFFK
ncbi:MAG: hypothetical protein ABIX01_01415 [Chitinophagaceae bacterium]